MWMQRDPRFAIAAAGSFFFTIRSLPQAQILIRAMSVFSRIGRLRHNTSAT